MILTKLQRFGREVSPFHRAAALQNELDTLFRQVFAAPLAFATEGTGTAAPPVNLYGNQEGLTVTVEIPGSRKEDIAISLDEDVLKVSGERKAEPQPHGATICRCERTAGKFERSLRLPYKVNADNIKANYTDGVLTITLPKAEEARPKQIPVEIK